MNRVWILFVVFFILGSGLAVFGQDQPKPAPYSQQALTQQLAGLLFGSRDNPSLAITHDQAQKLVPLLKRWQANPHLNASDAQEVWTKAQAVLTSDQKSFKPTRRPRPVGDSQPSRPQPPGSEQDRQARLLDRLIQRLEAS